MVKSSPLFTVKLPVYARNQVPGSLLKRCPTGNLLRGHGIHLRCTGTLLHGTWYVHCDQHVPVDRSSYILKQRCVIPEEHDGYDKKCVEIIKIETVWSFI